MADGKKDGFPLVLVGIGLGGLYWFVESFLYMFLTDDFNFFGQIFSPDLSSVYRRLIVICLLVMFGSHCQSRLKAYKEETDEWMTYAQSLESANPGASESELK